MIPGHYVSFEELIYTLDATRETLPDLIQGQETPRFELFPEVVLEEVDT